MNRPLKIFTYTLLIVIVFIVFMKIFFPFYRVVPDWNNPIIKDEFVIVSRFHYGIFEPKSDDLILLEPIEWIYEKNVWVSKIIDPKNFKYKNKIIWKIIISF